MPDPRSDNDAQREQLSEAIANVRRQIEAANSSQFMDHKASFPPDVDGRIDSLMALLGQLEDALAVLEKGGN